MFHLLGGIFLGWSLGANNAANLFGSAVSSHMIRFWRAAFLASLFVVLGAVLQGRHGIETLRGLSPLDLELAVLTSVAAAATVTGMTLLRLPVSASQAVVGAIVGAGLLQHQLYVPGLVKVAVCWFGTPLAGVVFSLLIYGSLGWAYNRSPYNLFQMDQITRIGLVIAGCYSAFALGSNNVANVTAVFVGAGRLDVFAATWVGGLSIALGILTFSRGVMETVGRDLVALDPYCALVVVLSGALAVHVYTWVGVPVSSSQAVVGAVLGVGILKGTQTIRKRTLLSILIAWFVTPLAGGVCFFLFRFLSHLRYVP
jgi:inorganic phosphate transporter, PiT family